MGWLLFWAAAIGCLTTGCILLPDRLARMNELDRLNVSMECVGRVCTTLAEPHTFACPWQSLDDFRELDERCVVLEVWNRPTDRREADGPTNRPTQHDMCTDDLVYLFAWRHPDGAVTGPAAVVRTQLNQLQDHCDQLRCCNNAAYIPADGDSPPPADGIVSGMQGYTACDRQGGWWMVATADAAIRASVQHWSTAVSRGERRVRAQKAMGCAPPSPREIALCVR